MSFEDWVEVTDGDPEGYERAQDEHEQRGEPEPEEKYDLPGYVRLGYWAGRNVWACHTCGTVTTWPDMHDRKCFWQGDE